MNGPLSGHVRKEMDSVKYLRDKGYFTDFHNSSFLSILLLFGLGLTHFGVCRSVHLCFCWFLVIALDFITNIDEKNVLPNAVMIFYRF